MKKIHVKNKYSILKNLMNYYYYYKTLSIFYTYYYYSKHGLSISLSLLYYMFIFKYFGINLIFSFKEIN